MLSYSRMFQPELEDHRRIAQPLSFPVIRMSNDTGIQTYEGLVSMRFTCMVVWLLNEPREP